MSKPKGNRSRLIFLSLFVLLVSTSAARADVKPAPLFSDHVVLESGMPVPIWGTASAVTIDIGDPTDVHPHDKEPLGDRLMRIALANVYHRKIEYSGPVYESMTVEGGTIRVKFSHSGGGLVAKDGPLKWFQIAGADRHFVDAKAKIDGESVIVSRGNVTVPEGVRYAWDNYPDDCNLYNAAGLPAAPFRTDKW